MTDFYISYLMGFPREKTDLLKKINIEVSDIKDSTFELKIPNDSLDEYERIIQEHLKPGFWNEYVGKDKIVFIFKFKSGEIKRFELGDENTSEISKLCSEFSGDNIYKTTSALGYISQNSFYHDMIADVRKDVLEFGTRNADSVYRKSITGVIFNPEKNKIIVLDWGIFPCPGLVLGGIEEGEELEEALRREVIEETGYTDFEIQAKLGSEIIANYFAANKNTWRTAEMHGFLVTLNSEKREEQKLEENEKFTLEWTTPQEYIDLIDSTGVTELNDFRPMKEFVVRALQNQLIAD